MDQRCLSFGYAFPYHEPNVSPACDRPNCADSLNFEDTVRITRTPSGGTSRNEGIPRDVDYELVYKPGKDEADPLDSLSRHPLPEKGDDKTEKIIDGT
ncbi:hypothetical protein ACROYT_G015926 [Oculina patagonica]